MDEIFNVPKNEICFSLLFYYVNRCLARYSLHATTTNQPTSLGDNGATNHHHHHRQCHQLQIALARVLDKLGPKRKYLSNGQNLFQNS